MITVYEITVRWHIYPASNPHDHPQVRHMRVSQEALDMTIWRRFSEFEDVHKLVSHVDQLAMQC